MLIILANLKVLYPQHKNIRVIVRGQIRGEVGMYAQAVVMVAREDDTHSVLLMADLVDDIHDVRKALMDLLMKTMVRLDHTVQACSVPASVWSW